jgi:hypothetical protein
MGGEGTKEVNSNKSIAYYLWILLPRELFRSLNFNSTFVCHNVKQLTVFVFLHQLLDDLAK